MERRSFFKIIGTASGGVLTGACGNKAREIIPLLVPEREIVAGVEEWHPSVCRECGAGCGTIVRVMEAEREIRQGNEVARERIAAIKKIEGNPLDPVSGGRLCARGQAAVQALYHPDRIRGPLKRVGARGEARFEPVTWDSALEIAVAALNKAVARDPASIVFLTRPETSNRSAAVASFLRALRAPPAATTGLCDFEIERKAAEIVFGWHGPPVYEIQDADYVLSLGADFLGGWVSPVFYARRFGYMRRGRAGRRGRLTHAESRFSLTASSADQWLPVRPGGELALALAIGHVLVAGNLASASVAAELRNGFASVDFERAVKISGLPVEQIRQVARDLGRSESPVVIAGASVVQSNSLDAVIAANALNLLLGRVGSKGGVMPPAEASSAEYAGARAHPVNLLKRLESAELVMLDSANPVYTQPASAKLLARAPAVLSFSAFIDDSSAYADVILPDHASLESAVVVVPDVTPDRTLTGAQPFVHPLYDTRATGQVLAELAKSLGRTISIDSPEDAFRKVFAGHKSDWSDADEFAKYCNHQGGWWAESTRAAHAASRFELRRFELPQLRGADFQGSVAEFPLHFVPYPALQFGDGSGAHLPWLQEMPDPASSAMWSLPVEIDPKTASRIGLKNGQMVRVVSPAGQLEAPAYVHPAAIPGVVSMAIGQGHAHYARYASGRGANPLTIAASLADPQTGAFAFGATRVRIEKLSRQDGLVQFSAVDREPEMHRR